VLDLYESVPRLQLQRHYGAGLSAEPLDTDQISRALKNVVGNAVEILSEHGANAGQPPRIDVRTGVEDEMARIEISDNGPGMSDEAERRIFEPYFTTKQQGTGLGMALTYRIIIEHGGMISAENRSAGGARVTIRLPLSVNGPGGAAGRTSATR
jgi:signal transduction histidine kinase